MHTPLVTILLPCRNAERTLYTALNSLLTQTFSNFELLFLDDGSTDNSVKIAESFLDSRICILSDGKCLGLSRRLNQGVGIANGRYIARMDADDVSFLTRFEKQVAFLDAHPEVDLVGTRAVVFKDSGQVIGLLPFAPDHITLCLNPWRNIPLPHPTWMGRHTWFAKHPYRIPEVSRAEDQELLLRSYPNSCYATLDEVLLGYRQGHFQLKRTLLARFTLLQSQLSLFAQRGEWANLTKAITLTTIKIFVDCLAALPGGDFIFFKRMKEPVAYSVKEALQCLLRATGEIN